MREIFASHPDTCCLADHNELPAGLPAMIVPPWPAEAAGSLAMPRIPADQVAIIVFTSGSTGRPQPHVKSWRSLVTAARNKHKVSLGDAGNEVMLRAIRTHANAAENILFAEIPSKELGAGARTRVAPGGARQRLRSRPP